MSLRWPLAIVLSSVLAGGCGGAAPEQRPSTPPQVVRLAAGGALVAVRKAPDTAQVALDLEGDPLPVDELIAAIEPAGKPDEVTRWSVEAAPASPAGVLGRVVVPTYAIPAGNFLLVLWRGDADVVGRYRFSVSPPSAD